MLVRSIGVLVAALALFTALPAGAAAQLSSSAQQVYDDYRSDAAIEPCAHTVAAYRQALREVTPAIEEETPAFRPAVEAALREREARRGCLEQDSPTQTETGEGGAAGGSAPPAQPAPAPSPAPPSSAGTTPAGPAAAAPDATPVPAPTVAPAPPLTDSAPTAPVAPVLLDRPHAGTPAGVLIALGLLACTALLVALAVLLRRLGWGEERLAGVRHAWGEAAYRAGATWADFVDWIRLGRGPHRL